MNTHPGSLHSVLRGALPALAEEARSRAEEFEGARRIAFDYVDRLKAAGLYRLLVAREQGGLGAPPNEWLRVITTLAYADASTGWTVAHGAACSALIANLANEGLLGEFLADPMASAAWSNQGKVKAREVAGGLIISGRWGFGTGCTAATHLGGMLRLAATDGEAAARFVVALARREQVRIDEVWDPVGLAGTGSHDIVFDDVFVPWSHTFTWPDCTPNSRRPTGIFVSGTWFITLCAAGTQLGLARRALDEVRQELGPKLDIYSRQPLLTKAAVLHTLEEAEGLLLAVQAGLETVLEEVWDIACCEEALSQDLRLRARLAAVTAVHQCERIVRAAYDAAGAGAIRRAGALQRVYRDASCLTHHVAANADSFEIVGRVRGGFDKLTFRV
ncbi:acyl-CoA dehydrogenase family protein [Desertibaculum subflavum]|uniref:acyl-CoA dehydrogenase family protein n=1 Tax=Desertibaculum subflavum TaxID=2268458 RepID=UPI0013C4BA67